MSDRLPSANNPEEAQGLLVEALGEPGKRRFRILLALRGETFIIWMEKQQLQALGLAMEQMLEHFQSASSMPQEKVPEYPPINRESEHQFRLGRVELGISDDAERIVISAFDIQGSSTLSGADLEEIVSQMEEDQQAPTLSFSLNRVQALYLSNEAETIAAAGRPLCPMCGSPMNPGGHVCPEQNGHLPISFEEDELA